MANDWNNVKPVGCKHWLVLPAVYSDALSYGDQIAHFCAALNKLIQNNNTLPEYIQQMIQDYINGNVIGEVVQNIVSQFILNVKYPPENLTPAVGDGSADDTEAIQGCINYAKNHNGMAVYIPSGAYSVQSLTLPGNVSLFGFDRYTTKLVLRGGATTPLISSTGTDFSIVGITLDGNSGIQVNDITVVSLISQDILIRDVVIEDGYKLLSYNGTGGTLQIDNVVFGNTVQRALEISGSSAVQGVNMNFTHLSAVGGVDVINIQSDGGRYEFISNAECATCLVVSGNGNSFHCSITGATTPVNNTGLQNNIFIDGTEITAIVSGNVTENIGGEANIAIGKNLELNVNKDYSENINGTYTSVRNSGESKIVTGDSITEYKGSQSETTTGKKTINAQDIFINPTNPLQYKTPTVLNEYFKYVEFKDQDNVYKVLVDNDVEHISAESGINPENYGAKLDGVTDDTEAIRSAINAATTLGKPVVFPYGKSFIASINADIKVTTTIDFNWCTFYPIGDENGRCFVLRNSDPSTIENVSLTAQNRINDSRLYSKTFSLQTDILLGQRKGTSTNIFAEFNVVTDEYGYVNGTLPIITYDHTCTAVNVRDIGKRIGIKNLIIDYSKLNLVDNNWCDTLVACTNSYIKNVIFKSDHQLLCEGRVITIDAGSAYVDISNIYGNSPWGDDSAGYVLYGSGAYVTVENCMFGCMDNNTWGSIGLRYVNDWTFNNVKSLRFDIHYMLYNSFNVYNSSFNTMNYPPCIQGTLNFEGCSIARYISDYIINQREDLSPILNGHIKFNGCTMWLDSAGKGLLLVLCESATSCTDLLNKGLTINFEHCVVFGNNNTFVASNMSADENFVVIFDDIKYNNSNSTLSFAKNLGTKNITSIIIKNSKFKGNTNFLSGTTVYPELMVENCDFGSGYILFDAESTVNTVKIFGCNFGGTTLGLNGKTFVCCNNTITTNRTISFGTMTNQLVNNNIIVASEKTQQSAWNNVLV